jgi:hypothetical protein
MKLRTIHVAQDLDSWRSLMNTGSVEGGKCLDQLSEYQLLERTRMHAVS